MKFLLPEDFATPKGRRRAWRSLLLDDHGVLRTVYDNTHRLSEEMWRSYQPSPGRIARWSRLGVRTIVNLRGLRNHERQPGFYFLEEEAAKRHGIRLVNFRAYSREAPKPEFILGLAELFDSIEYPALLHCKSGADRAGLASALYLFLRAERPLDEALQQLTFRYGHVRHGKTGVLGAFFDAYRAAARAEGAAETPEHFLSWVREEYDRDAVQAAFRPTTLGALLTEHVLRRE
ncbi:fused DSP-PTPase phosphatase/NAD kinase-like protein [Parvularcula oceani]|uniref:fused DSP-PTPase phosphatase/NAD kinase-like protein n=1 Tax=Parvularcula oceani TaxID=1247963 RepID=UPI0005699E61|nr:sulfur transferase domain-containing protein [Parvularcula oceani]